MRLIVGLGNPGKRYEKTRHNVGFMIVDELARKWTKGKVIWEENKKFNAEIYRPGEVLLIKPLTFMNASGSAVSKLAQFYKVAPEDIWVIHDDVDLPLGTIKIRLGGAAAGHHGVESIIEKLGTDQFLRIRLGIGHPGRGADSQVESYVLREFDINEKSQRKHLLKQTPLAIKVALKDGVEKAMSQFNR